MWRDRLVGFWSGGASPIDQDNERGVFRMKPFVGKVTAAIISILYIVVVFDFFALHIFRMASIHKVAIVQLYSKVYQNLTALKHVQTK
jgi:hypothetical protein